jgi:hypothetical protein
VSRNIGHHGVVLRLAEREPLGHIDHAEVDFAVREPLLCARNGFKGIVRRGDVEAGTRHSGRVVAGATPEFENPVSGGLA